MTYVFGLHRNFGRFGMARSVEIQKRKASSVTSWLNIDLINSQKMLTHLLELVECQLFLQMELLLHLGLQLELDFLR